MFDSKKTHSYLRTIISNLSHRLKVLLSDETVEIASGFQHQGSSALELSQLVLRKAERLG